MNSRWAKRIYNQKTTGWKFRTTPTYDNTREIAPHQGQISITLIRPYKENPYGSLDGHVVDTDIPRTRDLHQPKGNIQAEFLW